MATNVFYNSSERRLRALWRILLQGVIFAAGIILINLLIGMVAGLIVAANGGDLQDRQTILFIYNYPATRMATGILSVLAALLSYWVAGPLLDRRPFKAFGFHFSRRWWGDFAFSLVLGALLMVFIFGVELAAGWVQVTGTLQAPPSGFNFWFEIASYVIFFIAVGIYEEMLSRGYELRNLAEGLNFKALGPRLALLLAYLISSSMFGLFHLANENTTWVSTVNLIIAGLFLGLGFILTGELAIPIGLHITWNFFQGNVFGFPVSGGGTSATFISIQQGGPVAWTGGEFGPEAGLIGLIAMLLGSLVVFLWVRWSRGEAKLRDSLAVYQPQTSPEVQVNKAEMDALSRDPGD